MADGWLRERFGVVLGNQDLARVLGYRTGEAFRTAVRAGRVPVVTFRIPGRRGHFAKVSDVEAWLDQIGAGSPAGGGRPMS